MNHFFFNCCNVLNLDKVNLNSHSAHRQRKHLFVIELFAGSFVVGHIAKKLNSVVHKLNVGLEVIGYIGAELNPEFCSGCPSADQMGLVSGESHFVLEGADLGCSEVTEHIFDLFKKYLNFAKNSKVVVDGVLLIGGPPCDRYSKVQQGNLFHIERNFEKFVRECHEKDNLVQGTLVLYEKIKNFCNTFKNSNDSPVRAFIVLENPKSIQYMNIHEFIAKSKTEHKTLKGPLITQHPLGLLFRPFLKPYLVENGGFLKVTTHSWCRYRVLHEGARKDTWVFSNMLSFQNCTNEP